MSDPTQDYQTLKERFQAAGQGHVFRFWDELDDTRRHELLTDAAQIDLERISPLIDSYVRQKPRIDLPDQIEAPETYPAAGTQTDHQGYAKARAAGVDAIKAGRVAAFTVAGGQGTRLGYDGPKGCFPTTPIREAPLFQVFGEYLRGCGRRYGKTPPWYIMTSPLNHDATIGFFEEQNYFGLARDGVRFFQQGQVPAFMPDGRIAMAEKHRLALSPDGHGGSLAALRKSRALEEMATAGVKYISYFQVDNPLVHCVDPLFIGLHATVDSEMSSKAVRKASDTERVGNFCVADGKLQVIEYSDLPDELAHAKNPDGSRKFDAGSIAIHVISREFVERLTAPGSSLQLPWHRADKKVRVIDEQGHHVEPTEPNVVKLELFIFDAIPLAKNPLVLHTPREEEFSPVKNAEGNDSPATSRRDQIRRAARWLECRGATVPRDGEGEPTATLEISPLFAVDCDELCERLEQPPEVPEKGELLLADPS